MALALLSACATTQDVDEAKSSWQGATYEDVLRAWGAPARSAVTNDGRYWYTWETAAYPQPGASVGFGVGGVRFGGGGSGVGVGVGTSVPVGSPSPPERCERTLIFDNHGGRSVLGRTAQHVRGLQAALVIPKEQLRRLYPPM